MVRMMLLCGLAILFVVPASAEIQPQYLNSVSVQDDADLAKLGDIPVLSWEWASGRSILDEAPALAGGPRMAREHILMASGSQLKFTPPAKNLLDGKAPGGVLRLMKPVGASSQTLMARCTASRRIPSMKLALASTGASGAGKSTPVRLELKDAIITSYRVWGPGAGPREGLVGVPSGKPLEEISIAYGTIHVFLE